MTRLLHHLRPVLVGFVALAAALVVLPAVSVPPAAAASTYLCTGYASCKDAGYSHHGYRTEGKKMWWQMYSGHNCTNYVAYRMVQAGMSTTRPWVGGGNAEYWGEHLEGRTDQTPMVGAVAWWKADVPGAGSSGHVAYVERVISATEIVISEDSWGGDFHWRRMTKGTGWPSGFIHLADKAVETTTPVDTEGAARVGERLTARTGTWKPAASVAVQWLRDGKAIAGATSRTFTPTPAVLGHRLSVRVTAKKRGYKTGVVRSGSTMKVRRGILANPSAPDLSGTPRVGETLAAVRGSFSPRPDATTVQWYADGKPLADATTGRLELRPGLVGRTVTAKVRAVREGYRPLVVAADPTTVQRGRIGTDGTFAVTGTTRVGERLRVERGATTPRDADVTYTWVRDGRPIDGGKGASYAVRAADAGATLAVRARVTRPGYEPRTLTLPAPARITTRPGVDVDPVGGPRRAVVAVRVAAPGVPEPGGRVTVRIGTHEESARLVAGRARLVLTGLGAGRKRVRVLYSGTPVVEARRVVDAVRVTR
ncbi:CHAP domain-containing protein [Nocardioides sp. Leaf374]|uniref:CHAP domain-containing protein n=1 Tax=Nocardioides sp. Leaf374 TaxID=2876560 RepID=UPI001E288775|nr:CHAP domain-containing protein [Nocardioides sp. Leaf374]